MCALPLINRFAPWCWEASLSKEKRNILIEQQKILADYQNRFPVRQETHAAILGVLSSQFSDLKTFLKTTHHLIDNALKKNKASMTDLSTIKNNLNQIKKLTAKLCDAKLKHELRQKTRLQKTRGKRIMRRDQPLLNNIDRKESSIRTGITLFPCVSREISGVEKLSCLPVHVRRTIGTSIN